MHRRPRLLACSLFACLPAVGLLVAAGPAASASSARSAVSAGRPAARSLSVLDSQGWSGYVNTATSGNTFSSVSSSWTEPAVSCTSAPSSAPFWVGLDGFGSSTLEAAGTLAECSGGVASYYTWWEMYPSTGMQIVGSTVLPGDQITASVSRTGSQYTLKVTDGTTAVTRAVPQAGSSFMMGFACNGCGDVSSENMHGQPFPIDLADTYLQANFGSWTVSNATTKLGSVTGTISSFPFNQVNMIGDGGEITAQTSALSGGSFMVNFAHAGP